MPPKSGLKKKPSLGFYTGPEWKDGRGNTHMNCPKCRRWFQCHCANKSPDKVDRYKEELTLEGGVQSKPGSTDAIEGGGHSSSASMRSRELEINDLAQLSLSQRKRYGPTELKPGEVPPELAHLQYCGRIVSGTEIEEHQREKRRIIPIERLGVNNECGRMPWRKKGEISYHNNCPICETSLSCSCERNLSERHNLYWLEEVENNDIRQDKDIEAAEATLRRFDLHEDSEPKHADRGKEAPVARESDQTGSSEHNPYQGVSRPAPAGSNISTPLRGSSSASRLAPISSVMRSIASVLDPRPQPPGEHLAVPGSSQRPQTGASSVISNPFRTPLDQRSPASSRGSSAKN